MNKLTKEEINDAILKYMVKQGALKECKNWRRYRGLKKPTCNNGQPCARCTIKYLDRGSEQT